MHKGKQLLILVVLLAGGILSSCENNSYETTASGLKYKFIEKGEGEAPEAGEVMIMNMVYSDKDTVLFSSIEQGEPMPMPIDSTWTDDGSIYEVFKMLKSGDSVEIQITADNFYTKTIKQPRPDSVEAESIITFNIGVEDIMPMDDFRAFQMKQFEKRQEKTAALAVEQLKKDKTTIEEYLKENNIEAEATESGLSYIILEEGNGPEAEQGDTAVVDFTGTTLQGKMFYTSNMEMAKEKGTFEEGNPYEPLTFVIGAGQMIKGVDEGVALLKEGAKARFFLPSGLAYGERGAGADIKPHEIISFDVELMDIKNK